MKVRIVPPSQLDWEVDVTTARYLRHIDIYYDGKLAHRTGVECARAIRDLLNAMDLED